MACDRRKAHRLPATQSPVPEGPASKPLYQFAPGLVILTLLTGDSRVPDYRTWGFGSGTGTTMPGTGTPTETGGGCDGCGAGAVCRGVSGETGTGAMLTGGGGENSGRAGLGSPGRSC